MLYDVPDSAFLYTILVYYTAAERALALRAGENHSRLGRDVVAVLLGQLDGGLAVGINAERSHHEHVDVVGLSPGDVVAPYAEEVVAVAVDDVAVLVDGAAVGVVYLVEVAQVYLPLYGVIRSAAAVLVEVYIVPARGQVEGDAIAIAIRFGVANAFIVLDVLEGEDVLVLRLVARSVLAVRFGRAELRCVFVLMPCGLVVGFCLIGVLDETKLFAFSEIDAVAVVTRLLCWGESYARIVRFGRFHLAQVPGTFLTLSGRYSRPDEIHRRVERYAIGHRRSVEAELIAGILVGCLWVHHLVLPWSVRPRERDRQGRYTG